MSFDLVDNLHQLVIPILLSAVYRRISRNIGSIILLTLFSLNIQ